MKKTAMTILAITLLSRLLGLGRELTISYFYGVSMVSDAYFVASSIPTMVLDFAAAGIVTAYIPMLSQILAKEGEESANRYTAAMMGTMITVVVALLLVALALAPVLVRLMAVGFTGQVYDLAVNFTRICLLGLLFSSVYAVCTGYLQVKGNFVIPAMLGIPMNIVIIAGVVVSSWTNQYVMAAGYALAAGAQIGFMLPWMKKAGFWQRPKVDFGNPRLRQTLRLAMPVVAGVSANQLNIVVDKTIASTITFGGISAMNYASKLNLFIQGLFVSSLVAVIYPTLSKLYQEQDMDAIKGYLRQCFGIINLLVVPITVGALFFSKELVGLLFGRGAFDQRALDLTSRALFFYAFGIMGFGYRDLLARSFYSMKDTKTPAKNAMIGVVLNIGLNLTLSPWLGLGGLALATAISATVTSALLLKALRQRIGVIGLRRVVRDFPRLLRAAVVMGFVAKLFYVVAYGGERWVLILAILAGAWVYWWQVSRMRIPEVDQLRDWIKSKQVMASVREYIRKFKIK